MASRSQTSSFTSKNTFDLGLDNSSTIVEEPGHTSLLVLGVTSTLRVGFTLVLEHHLLHHVTVRVLVDTVAPHIGLSYIRIILLSRPRRWVYRWLLRWSSPDDRQTCQVDQVHHIVAGLTSLLLNDWLSLPM